MRQALIPVQSENLPFILRQGCDLLVKLTPGGQFLLIVTAVRWISGTIARRRRVVFAAGAFGPEMMAGQIDQHAADFGDTQGDELSNRRRLGILQGLPELDIGELP